MKKLVKKAMMKARLKNATMKVAYLVEDCNDEDNVETLSESHMRW